MSVPLHPNRRDFASLPTELHRPGVPAAARAWIADVTGAPVRQVRRLPGASTSAVHRVELASGHSLVLRRFVWPGFLESEPDGPRREADALALAASAGLPAPEVVAADPDGTTVGDGVPALLMTLLAGRAVAAPDVARLAQVAATVHDVGADDLGHDYFAWYRAEPIVAPDRTGRRALWDAAATRWLGARPAYRPSLIHRDFHPGNVLWSSGAVSGLVDWVNACRGPWGCDIAHCRDNLIGLAGFEVADRFLDAYSAFTGAAYDPYWEIASVLEHDVRAWTGPRLADAEQRLERALAGD